MKKKNINKEEEDHGGDMFGDNPFPEPYEFLNDPEKTKDPEYDYWP